MIDLSIIIINHNNKDLLKGCLNSVIDKSADFEKEIIVVDNNSTDGSAEAIKTSYPFVKLIENHQNSGFAKANNQGIAVSRGKYILLLNNDTVLLDNAFYEMVKFLNENATSGAVGCRLLNSDKTIQFSCYCYPSRSNILGIAALLFKGDCVMTGFKYDTQKEVDVVSGACLMVRRRTIDDIGLLDERFFIYAEEADWCLRAKRKGWGVFFIPQGNVMHYSRKTTDNLPGAFMAQVRENSNCLFFEKNYGKFVLILYRVSTYCATVPRIFIAAIIHFFNNRGKNTVNKRLEYYRAVLKGVIRYHRAKDENLLHML